MVTVLMNLRKCNLLLSNLRREINLSNRYSSLWRSTSILEAVSLKDHENIQVEGWVTAMRKMKTITFIDINDGSSLDKLQIAVHKDKIPEGLSCGAAIRAFGQLRRNKINQSEVLVSELTVLGKCNNSNFPLPEGLPYTAEDFREYMHLRPRTEVFSSLLRVRHNTNLCIHKVFDKNGYIQISSPVLTTNDCEDGGEVFMVVPENKALLKEMKREDLSEEEIFFGDKTYLSVSGQLHLEAAARGLKKVYNLGPIFRAENSRSKLHLSEFYMLEAEIAFIEDIDDLTQLVEKILKELIASVLMSCSNDIQLYQKLTGLKGDQIMMLNKIVNEKFITMTYSEAFKILENNRNRIKSSVDIRQGINKEQELFLVEYSGHVPVFVVEWPKDIKPFYMKPVPGNENLVEAMDLLVSNIGEICGGSIREDNYNRLKQKIEENNFGSKLDWYLQLREFGNVTTGGFGMGLERFLQFILGTNNIKDTIPFPRWPHSCKL